ncbi:hypothetical protein [Phaeospirillum tilakii]|uniref:Sulfotransferase family protein n=1 Tax=Phaeospirillum tilakii TaxID=741673 RepID=A0ABW5CE55_9PROT
MAEPFVIWSVGRSGTRWAATFLSAGPWVCCHDLSLRCSSVADLERVLGVPRTGTAETGMLILAPLIRRLLPRARFVVIRRPVDEVRASFAACGPAWEMPDGLLEAQRDLLDGIAAMPGTLVVDYANLTQEDTCRAIWGHCLDIPWDAERWAALAGQNIQIDMAARARECDSRLAQIRALASDIADMSRPVEVRDTSWNEAVKGGLVELGARHWAEAGTPGDPYDPNIALLEHLAGAGALQITGAWAGRHLVGYLFFLLSPSFNGHSLEATRGAVYLRPGWRGPAGIRLYRTALDGLRARGVARAHLRAGIRGAGDRQATMIRRLGGQPDGELFTIDLRGA